LIALGLARSRARARAPRATRFEAVPRATRFEAVRRATRFEAVRRAVVRFVPRGSKRTARRTTPARDDVGAASRDGAQVRSRPIPFLTAPRARLSLMGL
jgi:hypothetical protein